MLTIDLGTTMVKADVWHEGGPRAAGSAALRTEHPGPRRDEQDASTWWPAVVDAGAAARAEDPDAYAAVEVVALSGARQTVVAATDDGGTRGRAILWSDRRGVDHARAVAARAGGAERVLQRTGQHLDGGSVAAKLAWLDDCDPERLGRTRWLLAPRDLMIQRMVGEVVTDTTMATATGLYDADLAVVVELVGAHLDRLAPPVEPGTVVGALRDDPAAALGLRSGTPVVIGAGDRACEALGTDAAGPRAMVSWGTTANASRAVRARPDPVPDQLAVSRAVEPAHWLVEAGLSAAGSLLDRLSHRTGRTVGDVVAAARSVPPGADGVVVLPWLDGARAPWWRDDVDLQVLGAHDPEPAALARAMLEGVARDLHRCLRTMSASGSAVEAMALTGRGASVPTWVEVVTGVTGLPGVIRRSVRRGAGAAAVGTALLAARSLGLDWSLDRLDPVDAVHEPDLTVVDRYAELAADADRAAAAALGHRPDTDVRY